MSSNSWCHIPRMTLPSHLHPLSSACLRKIKAAKIIYFLFQPAPEDRVLSPSLYGSVGAYLGWLPVNKPRWVSHWLPSNNFPLFVIFYFPDSTEPSLPFLFLYFPFKNTQSLLYKSKFTLEYFLCCNSMLLIKICPDYFSVWLCLSLILPPTETCIQIFCVRCSCYSDGKSQRKKSEKKWLY